MAILNPTLNLAITTQGLTNGLSGIELSWFATPVYGETGGYLIERKTELTDWGYIGTTATHTYSFIDKKYLSPNKLYTYRLRALENISFGYSNPVSIMIPSRGRENFTYCNSGKFELLEDYFPLRSSDLYLGLWISPNLFGLPNTDFISLNDFSSSFELNPATFSGYQRIRIPKNDCLVDPVENIMYLKATPSFRSLNTWNNISGFFLSTTSDNSGKLIVIDRFKTEGTALDLEPDIYLNISPRIGLL